jgi:hypothetical protein
MTLGATFKRTARFKKVNNSLNTNIYSYLETSGGQNSNLYLNVIHFYFFNTSVNKNLWQNKTVVFLHWCLIRADAVYLVMRDPSMNEL